MPCIQGPPQFKGAVQPKLKPEIELLMACSYGTCPERIERVLKKNPNINFKNDAGETALHRAAYCANVNVMKRLLDLKADPNVKAGFELETPIDVLNHRMARDNERDQRLGTWNGVMKCGNTVCHIVPNHTEHKKCIELLKKHGGLEGYQIGEDGWVYNQGESKLRGYDPKYDYLGWNPDDPETYFPEEIPKTGIPWEKHYESMAKIGRAPFNPYIGDPDRSTWREAKKDELLTGGG